MRRLILTGALILSACGQSNQTATQADAATPSTPQAAAIGSPAAAPSATVAIETRSAFVDRCTKEAIAANPQSQTWAKGACEQRWQNVVASAGLAEAVLALAPATPAPTGIDSLRAKLPMVTWAAKPEGTLAASGKLDPLDVEVQSPPAQIAFRWSKVGELIPFDLEEALRGRGATVSMIGCQAFGAGEATRAYVVNAPGKAPFGLTIYAREAPTGDASSSYAAAVDLSGKVPTLKTLGSPDDGWAATCAS